ncbi:hypothetical protein SDJN02_10428, partial [Cucurbita argyrosperma subsp. argyrosperma]
MEFPVDGGHQNLQNLGVLGIRALRVSDEVEREGHTQGFAEATLDHYFSVWSRWFLRILAGEGSPGGSISGFADLSLAIYPHNSPCFGAWLDCPQLRP